MPETESNEIAFFVTRIDDEGSQIRKRTDHVGKYILLGPLERRGLELRRADQDPGPARITEKIVNNILSARVVIVDATGKNPNVFYELGLAHAFRRPVILLIDSVKEIPFDIHDSTFIEIGDDGKIGAEEAERASAQFEDSLAVVLGDDFKPSSPVTAAGAVAQLESSDDPGEVGLAEVLKRLDSMEGEIRRARVERSDFRETRRRSDTTWNVVVQEDEGVFISNGDGRYLKLRWDEILEARAAFSMEDFETWLVGAMGLNNWSPASLTTGRVRSLASHLLDLADAEGARREDIAAYQD